MDWAVDKLIKLITARSSINIAIPIRLYMAGRSAVRMGFSITSELKWMWFNGSSQKVNLKVGSLGAYLFINAAICVFTCSGVAPFDNFANAEVEKWRQSSPIVFFKYPFCAVL